MLPPLVYVLTISAAIHLVNYYGEAVVQGVGAGAPRWALAHGWRPCTLAAATTAVVLSGGETTPDTGGAILPWQ